MINQNTNSKMIIKLINIAKLKMQSLRENQQELRDFLTFFPSIMLMIGLENALETEI